MFFNYKERISKTKQERLIYEMEKVNEKFSNSLPKQIKLKTEMAKMDMKENESAPKILVVDYAMALNIIPPPDKNIPYIKNNIIKIVNVYQEFYKNSKKASGFGDFIRGMYFIIQFCERYKIKCDMEINHPIKKYLKLYSNGASCESNLTVGCFVNPNFHVGNPENSINEEIVDEFVEYLKTSEINFKDKIATVYTISFPFEPISNKQRNIIRQMLEPVDEFKPFILNSIKKMQLIIKNYIVIHVRSGDNMLINKEDINLNYLKNVVSEINKVYAPNCEYLLLSDSVKLKGLIISTFPRIKATFNEITHSGEGVKLTDENVKNTMLDFYLLAYSNRIYSYSCYDHGSGFSRWCAETFNIPYSCVIVK